MLFSFKHFSIKNRVQNAPNQFPAFVDGDQPTIPPALNAPIQVLQDHSGDEFALSNSQDEPKAEDTPKDPILVPPACSSEVDTNVDDEIDMGLEKKTTDVEEYLRLLRQDLETTQNQLAEEQALHSQTKNKLQSLQKNVVELRKQKREITTELDKIARQSKGLDQMMDNDLAAMVSHLRSEIRGFTMQFFEEPIDMSRRRDLDKHMRVLRKGTMLNLSRDKAHYYVSEHTVRSKIMQDYIWNWLIHQVFDQYIWAPEDSGKAMYQLKNTLEIAHCQGELNPNCELERTRKYHLWRANTSKMMQETAEFMHHTPEGPIDRRLSLNLAEQLTNRIQFWYSSKNVAPRERLVDIMNQGLLLDLAISKQIAKVGWHWLNKEGQHSFDPTTMELELGQAQHTRNEKVELVLAPGLMRLGRASGDGADESRVLIKSEVVVISG